MELECRDFDWASNPFYEEVEEVMPCRCSVRGGKGLPRLSSLILPEKARKEIYSSMKKADNGEPIPPHRVAKGRSQIMRERALQGDMTNFSPDNGSDGFPSVVSSRRSSLSEGADGSRTGSEHSFSSRGGRRRGRGRASVSRLKQGARQPKGRSGSVNSGNISDDGTSAVLTASVSDIDDLPPSQEFKQAYANIGAATARSLTPNTNDGDMVSSQFQSLSEVPFSRPSEIPASLRSEEGQFQDSEEDISPGRNLLNFRYERPYHPATAAFGTFRPKPVTMKDYMSSQWATAMKNEPANIKSTEEFPSLPCSPRKSKTEKNEIQDQQKKTVRGGMSSIAKCLLGSEKVESPKAEPVKSLSMEKGVSGYPIVVDNLPDNCDAESLEEIMKQYGEVVQLQLHRNGDKSSRADVIYKDEDASIWAIESLNGEEAIISDTGKKLNVYRKPTG